ncbi:hypothetical protein [Streptomyces sp. NRRL F-5135]|uniref:hypothetical protein n=1 Tax=Streptomyces sp. NRRL F-5135 TaxID=1463858 RepID=UPI0004C4C654|nr:hypothetical protein [Streptomyces sp. NRRL F-5135]
MRVRLTDGTREIDIRTDPGEQQPTLDQIEATAIRLLTALDHEPADTEPKRTPIGFTAQCDLDRVSLDSAIERSDQDDETERYDEPEDGTA